MLFLFSSLKYAEHQIENTWDMEAVNRRRFKVASDLAFGAAAEQHRGCYGSFGSATLGRFGGADTWGSAFVIERVVKMHGGGGERQVQEL